MVLSATFAACLTVAVADETQSAYDRDSVEQRLYRQATQAYEHQEFELSLEILRYLLSRAGSDGFDANYRWALHYNVARTELQAYAKDQDTARLWRAITLLQSTLLDADAQGTQVAAVSLELLKRIEKTLADAQPDKAELNESANDAELGYPVKEFSYSFNPARPSVDSATMTPPGEPFRQTPLLRRRLWLSSSLGLAGILAASVGMWQGARLQQKMHGSHRYDFRNRPRLIARGRVMNGLAWVGAATLGSAVFVLILSLSKRAKSKDSSSTLASCHGCSP